MVRRVAARLNGKVGQATKFEVTKVSKVEEQ